MERSSQRLVRLRVECPMVSDWEAVDEEEEDREDQSSTTMDTQL